MAIVLIIREDETSRRVKLTARPLIAGRSSKSPLRINDALCSGQHCAFVISNEFRVLVKDLESTNGTFLNDCKIMDSHIMLDDIIKIGECEILIDPSELTPKEKRHLTRDEPTSKIKFVSLKPEAKLLKPSEALRAKANKEAQELLKQTREPKKEPKNELSREEIIKQRVTSKAKSLSNSNKADIESPSSERTIDLEESSGATKMIKIGKTKKAKKSLASKIKGVFKK